MTWAWGGCRMWIFGRVHRESGQKELACLTANIPRDARCGIVYISRFILVLDIAARVLHAPSCTLSPCDIPRLVFQTPPP